MNLYNYFIIGFIIGGIGTCIGGLLSIIIKDPSDKVVSCLLNFAAGIMLSIISFDLMPKAYEISGFFIVTLGLCIGLFAVFFAEEAIPSSKLKNYCGRKLKFLKMSMMIMISIGLHNFPEGVAIGSSYVYSKEIGLKLGILIAAHSTNYGRSVSLKCNIINITHRNTYCIWNGYRSSIR